MKFQRKQFSDARSIIVSQRPLNAAVLEERISSLIPAMEASIDSFEDYHSAYSHCSETRTVGMFYIHWTEKNDLPLNFIDELSAPFEAIGSSSGLFVIAENEKAHADAYKVFGGSQRLLKIVLENDLKEDSDFKNAILDSWEKFETLQIRTAVPREEIEFISKIAARFEDTELLTRMTNIITSKLDKSWYDELIVEAGPAIMSLPDQQKWILNNSKSLTKLGNIFTPYLNSSVEELINSKDDQPVVRAVITAYKIFQKAKSDAIPDFLETLTKGSSAFAPTLKKILAKEKLNILDLYKSEIRKAAA